MEEKIKRFEDLLMCVEREGIMNLIDFIRKSDFYKAPASTKYHSCHEGGLLEHTLNVYDCLCAKRDSSVWAETFKNIPDDTLIIVALLHDLCKTYFYTTEMRNKKDENGKWVQVPFYTTNDIYPLGHGSHSVIFAQKFITLTMEEIMAINWHMGWSVPKEDYNYLGKAMRKYPLVLALHEADEEATYLMEDEM